MANSSTPLGQAKELEARIQVLASSFDVDALPGEQQKLLTLIRRQATDARLDVREYEYAETRLEQQQSGVAARMRLEDLRKNILKASEHNLFGSVDVAQLSAQIEQLIEAAA